MLEKNIPASWKKHLGAGIDPTFNRLQTYIAKEISAGKTIFPPEGQIFQALQFTSIEQVKVVILGQDPYHGPGQAHGLSFSVPEGERLPPSLRNIYKELAADLGTPVASSGNLSRWAKQGVLLLNAVLTVESGLAGSHAGKGWETFTDKVVEKLNHKKEGMVFILWGAYAQKKGSIVDSSRHLVLSSAHPSPLSASRGFFGSRPFSAANRWLKSRGMDSIDWSLL